MKHTGSLKTAYGNPSSKHNDPNLFLPVPSANNEEIAIASWKRTSIPIHLTTVVCNLVGD
jgi:hypothetical protein